MAEDIKVIGNINNKTILDRYSIQDNNLIPSINLPENFGGEGDYIEYFIYDRGNNLLYSDYRYSNYKLPSDGKLTPSVDFNININNNIQTSNVGILSNLSQPTSSILPIIEIDPIKDIQQVGYNSGEFSSRYNIFKEILSNNIDRALFIKEISPNRTELRLSSTTLSNDEIEKITSELIKNIGDSSNHNCYLLNFGENIQFIIINIALDRNIEGYEILVKIYNPLPLNISEKDTLWVVEEKTSSYIFEINLDKFISPPQAELLKGPNFNIKIPEQSNISTPYINYATAVSNLQSLQSSSYNQLLNIITSQSIHINVDYSDFNNFVFFGSAYQRVCNFYNKVKQIESYQEIINVYSSSINTTSSLQNEINLASSSINNIISNFDGYETYLYFESNSYAWPKSGSYKPYDLLPSSSPIINTWYNNLTSSALLYDTDNYDNLTYVIPSYIRDDDNNNPFILFVNMIGQYFDNIRIYIKAITDINLANNNLHYGISKDLVYDRLNSLGVKLYDSQAGESLDLFLIGANTGSNIFDNDFSISGSYLNNIPRKDLLSELYKRIYHNLPLLLKTKGTKTGLEYLISTFGIPSRTYITGSTISSSILDVKEYGGGVKNNFIKGYNNEKVRIVDNSITGNVLSSLLSLQTFPTNSLNFRENDSHFIDVSFSPEDQINTYISSSINNNNPNWLIDDYIGDPRNLYSNSYSDLDNQRKLYFETGTPGYPGFTSSLLDYNGFIRLIQFFDNSLFKMIEDFVPERTSLSTGITIESPVLERNKVSYSIPQASTIDIYDAQYFSPTINYVYTDLYNNLGGDKKPYITGDISGSKINIYDYFRKNNYNPYLEGHPNTNWVIYNSKHSENDRIYSDLFVHSDYNVLINNIHNNIVSKYRNKIEPIWGTTDVLTSSIELQDSYLNLNSYIKSRYNGIQLISKEYNTYTSSSYLNNGNPQKGDISYGKSPVINRNSYKLGWIKSIPSQSLNFSDKTTINLKYLIDVKKDITDLNSYNNNVFEIQNIFKSGKPVTLSIIDKNQNKRDGFKNIWRGGYRYDPVIYRENREVMNFIFDEPQYTASLPLGFLLSDTNRYEYETDQLGGDPKTPNTVISNSPNQDFFYINDVASYITPTNQNRLAPEIIGETDWIGRNGVTNNNKLNYNIISSIGLINNDNGYSDRRNAKGYVYRFDLFNFNNKLTFQNDLNRSGFLNEPISESLNNNIYTINRAGDYTVKAGVECTLSTLDIREEEGDWSLVKMALLVESCSLENYQGGNKNWSISSIPMITQIDKFPEGTNSPIGKAIYDNNKNIIRLDSTRNASAYERPYIKLKFKIDNIIPNASPGTVFRLSFYFIDVQNMYKYADNINIKFSNAYWGMYDSNNNTTEYYYDSQYLSSDDIFSSIENTNRINDTLGILPTFSSKYFYSSSFSGNSLNYSEVIDKISIEKGDIIKFGRFQDTGNYYEVIKVNKNNNQYSIVLDNSITTASLNNLSSNFAVLRPKEDETSVILEGKNAVGRQNIQTSLLVPYDASDELNNNIGNIIKTLNNLV